MPFRVEFAPSASLIGNVAQQAGFGQYATKQRQIAHEQAMEQARFQADLMDRQARFMASEHQRAIENQMRAQNMAESAMRNRAEFGLQAQQAEFGNMLKQAHGFADYEKQQQDYGLKRDIFNYSKEHDEAQDLLRREIEISRQAGFDRMNQNKLGIEQERSQRQWDMLEEKGRQALEMAGVKFNARENQQIETLNRKEAFLQGKLDEGGMLNPQWQAQLRGVQAERNLLIGAAKQRTIVDEAVEAQQRQKDIDSRHYVRDGVPYIRDQYGVPHIDPAYQEEQKHVAKFTQDHFAKNGSYPSPEQVQGFRDVLRGKVPPSEPSFFGRVSGGPFGPYGGDPGGFNTYAGGTGVGLDQAVRGGAGGAGGAAMAMAQQVLPALVQSATSTQDFLAKVRQQFPNATDEEIALMLRRLKGG